MLEIQDLHARIDGRDILDGLSLSVGAGEVHAVMGPNGSGKSTLAHVLAGREDDAVTGGTVTLDGEPLLEMSPEDRALRGLFLGFQYPVEIPGVSNMMLLRTAINARRKAGGEDEIDAMDFLAWVRGHVQVMKMDDAMLHRGVNEGFSGGEKKRNEILQMLVLQPRMVILDETDSGLDIDALKIVADGINAFRSAERGLLLITHYQRLLDLVQPDRVHVLARGRVVRSGGPELARELEARGYGWLDVAPADAG